MTYQVLARKWRPNTFDEVVGQDYVVKALKGALDLKNFLMLLYSLELEELAKQLLQNFGKSYKLL